MQSAVEWQVLTDEWAQSLSRARIKEAVIADRMNSFLKGNGCLPSMEDLNEVEALWDIHVKNRNQLNQYVAKVIQHYQHAENN